ncbi:hypothetical protein BDV26DRAFT_63776 [Aspergillus bertholletiae]|uniref:Rhodopsin domain-containing protein n=1 Tax=Aspergillus bertholletiae TaxID=1226010 RepID=A0A5N7BIV6_9EURO|nr:hypothetical protein BDV26DRAFT_63776 [Aspergillus bertholletiae]
MGGPYAITTTDQRGLIIITATLFMSWMCTMCLFRLHMRLTMNGPLGPDDLAAFVGSALGVSHVGAVMASVSYGFGRPLQHIAISEATNARKALYAADLLFLAGHSAAKVSVCLLLRRLGQVAKYVKWCNVTLIVIGLWALASILGIAVSWQPSSHWDLSRSVTDRNTGWKVLTSVDVVIEALLVGLSIFLVWDIHMPRKRKVAVICAFSTRTVIIIAVIVRQVYINRAFEEPHMPVRVSSAVIATEVLLHCSLMAATVPCIKPFIASFDTGWGQGTIRRGNSYFAMSIDSDSHHVPHLSGGIAEPEVSILGSAQSQDSQSLRQLITRREGELIPEFELIDMRRLRKQPRE